ncbi:MAG: hypothetical protein KatS3mg031_2895 [Chitinophagales bacterium]|nr:MAG: hypothetical protein KatS3mg031_2895 [Chitinophagales bacterium]
MQKYKFIIIDPANGRLQPGRRSLPFAYKSKIVQFEEWEFAMDIANIIYNEFFYRKVYATILNTCWSGNHTKYSINYINAFSNYHGPENVFFISIRSNAVNRRGWFDTSGVTTIYYNAREEAEVFQRHITSALKAYGFKDRGVKYRRNVSILKNTLCKGIITQTGYYTNINEAMRLMDVNLRYEIAHAHVNAIKELCGWQ